MKKNVAMRAAFVLGGILSRAMKTAPGFEKEF